MTSHVSRWFTIDQDRIDAFAEVTEDRQDIHLDPNADSPFDGTIAHGFLTLSMLSAMAYDVLPKVGATSINYGFDRIRFVGPVPSGRRIRGKFTPSGVDRTLGYVSQTWNVVIEVEDSDRPAIVATWLTRHELEQPLAQR